MTEPSTASSGGISSISASSSQEITAGGEKSYAASNPGLRNQAGPLNVKGRADSLSSSNGNVPGSMRLEGGQFTSNIRPGPNKVVGVGSNASLPGNLAPTRADTSEPQQLEQMKQANGTGGRKRALNLDRQELCSLEQRRLYKLYFAHREIRFEVKRILLARIAHIRVKNESAIRNNSTSSAALASTIERAALEICSVKAAVLKCSMERFSLYKEAIFSSKQGSI